MIDTVAQLQDRVNAALLASDWQTLEELVDPNAGIVGPRGFMISRNDWIGVHRESAYEQLRLETHDTDVRQYDGAAIRFDVVDSECRYRGETIKGRFRVMQAWAARSGRWRLVAIQYTALAG
ncbi:MAG TPA: nuclear transport factor 2 family protein [Gaiellaceae bacterium]|nr:nuclear transport factor 2 family protein [Gaiellaceae bacterium]